MISKLIESYLQGGGEDYNDELTSDNAEEEESIDENYKAITDEAMQNYNKAISDQALGISTSKH